MLSQLPALQIVIPLLAAPLCALLPLPRLAWGLATLTSVVATLIAAMLLVQTADGLVLSYAMGGWEPPWGIEYRIDAVNALVLLLVAAMGTAAMAFAWTSVPQEIPVQRQGLFYTAYLLCLTGLLGIAATGDAFNVFVFLEISSLSSYALISLGRDRRALTASYQYLIMGTIGATFILIGIGLLYVETGTLNMADLYARIPAVSETRTARAAFAFLTIGISLKVALFPLHLWLPGAYAYAPTVVGIFLAATATKVAIYLLLRFFFSIFGSHFSFGEMQLGTFLLPLALIGIFATSLAACYQASARKVLAYSSIAQLGYMILGVSFASLAGVSAALIHLVNHGVMKAALFMALGCVFYRIRSVRIDDMAGLGQQMPLTMAAFVIGGVSLIGVPLTAGFISKWYLIQAALESGDWWVALLILLSSLIAVAYIWKIVEVAYFRDPPPDRAVAEAPLTLLVPTGVLAGLNILLGVIPMPLTSVANQAAISLIGVSP